MKKRKFDRRYNGGPWHCLSSTWYELSVARAPCDDDRRHAGIRGQIGHDQQALKLKAERT